jgi:hypothetical protein
LQIPDGNTHKKPQSLLHHHTSGGFYLSILLNARRPQIPTFLKMQHVVFDERREQKGLEILDVDNLKEFTTLCDELPADFKSQYILEGDNALTLLIVKVAENIEDSFLVVFCLLAPQNPQLRGLVV